MNAVERFDLYLEHLSEGLGHADRHVGRRGYCTGLTLPLSRKSVEPVAWQLYLPKEWAADLERRAKAGVPEEVHFATKTQIAQQRVDDQHAPQLLAHQARLLAATA